MSELSMIRRRAGLSRDRVAVLAGVSYPTCRVFEASPEMVRDPAKRARLERVYDGLLRQLADAEAATKAEQPSDAATEVSPNEPEV